MVVRLSGAPAGRTYIPFRCGYLVHYAYFDTSTFGTEQTYPLMTVVRRARSHGHIVPVRSWPAGLVPYFVGWARSGLVLLPVGTFRSVVFSD